MFLDQHNISKKMKHVHKFLYEVNNEDGSLLPVSSNVDILDLPIDDIVYIPGEIEDLPVIVQDASTGDNLLTIPNNSNVRNELQYSSSFTKGCPRKKRKFDFSRQERKEIKRMRIAEAHPVRSPCV
uniref:Uncharacterized protein n=1 Tax=Photinus pyralis TaxID=7054 RepID=A0A1Y1MVK2_PHOPY